MAEENEKTDQGLPDEQVARDHRLYWRSRRGMTELELKLIPFFRTRGDRLSDADKAAYERLLDEEDWQIFDWLQGREHPQDAALADIVAQIRAFGAEPRDR